MKKSAIKKSQPVNEKDVTDLKIKKLTVRSGVKAAMGCTPCHTPGHGALANVTNLGNVLAGINAINVRF
jgi:hypothetical protein